MMMFSFVTASISLHLSCLLLVLPQARTDTTLSPQCLQDLDQENLCFAACNINTGNASNVPICQALCHNTCLGSSGGACCPSEPSQVGSIHCCEVNDVITQDDCNQAAVNETNCFIGCASLSAEQIEPCKKNCKGQCLTESCEECCPAYLPSVCGAKVVLIGDCLTRADDESQCGSLCSSVDDIDRAVCLSQCHESCLSDTCAFQPEISCDVTNCCPLQVPTFCAAKAVSPQACQDARAEEQQCIASCANSDRFLQAVCEEKCSPICLKSTCAECCSVPVLPFCNATTSGTDCLAAKLELNLCSSACFATFPNSNPDALACIAACQPNCQLCEDPCCPVFRYPVLCGTTPATDESFSQCIAASANATACYSTCAQLPTVIQRVMCLEVTCKSKCEFETCRRCCPDPPGSYCGSKMLTPAKCLAAYNAQLACSNACGNTPCRRNCYNTCKAVACDSCCVSASGTTRRCNTIDG